MSTYMAKNEEVNHGWVVVDLENQTLGRAATKIADILRGKHRPTFTRHVDTGDCVIVLNAAKIKLTGKKHAEKMYRRHSGYMGGLTSTPAGKLLIKKPEELITQAVKGMLPRNFLSKDILKKLKVYPGTKHPHTAQKAEKVTL